MSLFAAVATGKLVGWFGVAFFGFGLAAFALDRVRPTTMEILQESLEVIGPLGGRKSYQYSSCGPFGVFRQSIARGQRVDWLTFDYDGEKPRTWPQRANSRMAGTNSQLRMDGFDEGADEIAELLNRYRARARAQPTERER